MRKNLTEIVVQKTRAPASGQTDIFDLALPGFGLRLSWGGARTFFVMYRTPERRLRRMTIGNAKLIGLGEARKQAIEALRLVDRGQDPKGQSLTIPTFRAVITRYLSQYAEPNLRPRTAAEKRRLFEHDALPAWGERPIDSIRRADVVTLVEGIARRDARVGANRHLSALRAFFNWAIANAILSESPCAGMKPPTREHARERTLSEDEIRAFWRGCGGATGAPFGDIFRLLLVTAQRESEVGLMRWREVDLDKRLWTIPAERAKNRKFHTVALSDLALEILARQPRAGDDGFVFPSKAKSAETAVSGYSKAKKRLDAAMGVREPFILHDLRRTAATQMAEIGIAPQVVDRVLNHVSGTIRGVAAIYNRHEYRSEQRAALLAWGERLAALLST